MIDYRYMSGDNEYENEGEWTKAELEAMLNGAEDDIYYYDKKIDEFNRLLYNAEEQHEMATYLLDNELWYVEEAGANVLHQTKENDQ
jgi:hypothetical protein